MKSITFVIPHHASQDPAECRESFTETANQPFIIKPAPNFGQGLGRILNQVLPTISTDLAVIAHDDVRMLTQGWDNRLSVLFTAHSDLGLAGIAGTRLLDRTGYWARPGQPYLRGQVLQPEGEEIKAHLFFPDDLDREFTDTDYHEVVAVDGCFMVLDMALIREGLRWDADRFDGFHFYDIPVCQAIRHRFDRRIAVIPDFRILHLSEGGFDDRWNQARVLFQEISSGMLPDALDPLPADLAEQEQKFEHVIRQLFSNSM